MTPRSRFRWLQRGLVILGLALLAQWSKTSCDSRGFQAAESGKLEAALRDSESVSPERVTGFAAFVGAPAPDAPKPTADQERVLGRIEIQRLRVAAIIAEGTDAKTLQRAVGHITSTARPGEPGNCALAGHRDTFLRGLRGVRVDDVIHVVTRERTYTYRVEWSVVVEPRRVDVLDSTATRSLTLVTCYPFEFIGQAPQRFVVRAKQVEAVADSLAIEDRGPFQPQGLTAQGR